MRYCQQCGMQWSDGEFCPYCGTLGTEISSQPVKKSTAPWVIVLIISVCVLFIAFVGVFFLIMLNAFRSYQQKVDEIFPDTQSRIEESSAGIADYEASGIYPSGTYAVGKDIPPGEYVLLSDTELTGGYGDFPVTLYDSNPQYEATQLYMVWAQNCHIVELQEGQYLHFSHSVLYDPKKHEITMDPFSKSGMYRVGEHVEPGTYALQGDGSDHGMQYTIYASIAGELKIRESGTITENTSRGIVLQAEEYIALKFCCLSRDLPENLPVSTTPIMDVTADGVYPEGVYAVGEDIPAGRYFAISNSSTIDDHLYVSVYPNASLNDDDAVIRGWMEHFRLLELEEGQYIKIMKGNLCDLSKVELPFDPFVHGGMYLVGEHLEAGTYTIIPTDKQYGAMCSVFNHVNCTFADQTDMVYVSCGDTDTITLEEGQYVYLERCHLE